MILTASTVAARKMPVRRMLMILNAGSELVYFARPGPVPGPFKLVTVL